MMAGEDALRFAIGFMAQLDAIQRQLHQRFGVHNAPHGPERVDLHEPAFPMRPATLRRRQ
jgi:hypothetical protein